MSQKKDQRENNKRWGFSDKNSIIETEEYINNLFLCLRIHKEKKTIKNLPVYTYSIDNLSRNLLKEK